MCHHFQPFSPWKPSAFPNLFPFWPFYCTLAPVSRKLWLSLVQRHQLRLFTSEGEIQLIFKHLQNQNKELPVILSKWQATPRAVRKVPAMSSELLQAPWVHYEGHTNCGQQFVPGDAGTRTSPTCQKLGLHCYKYWLLKIILQRT